MRCEPLVLEDPPQTSLAPGGSRTFAGANPPTEIDYFEVNSSWGWFFRSLSINELSVCNRNLGSELLVSRFFAYFATLIPQLGYNEAPFFVLSIVDRSEKISSHESLLEIFQTLALYIRID